MKEERGISKTKSIALVVSCAMIVLFPFINQFLKVLESPKMTKRIEKVEFSLDIQDLDAFPGNTEEWFEQNISARENMLKWYISFKENMLDSHPFPSKVLKGDSGWYFYGSESQNYFEGEMRYSEIEINWLEGEFNRRAVWCKTTGKTYYLVIAPSKHDIYPEYLPSILKNNHKPVRLNQLKAIASKYPGLNIIDLSEEIKKHKADQTMFYKTDHHWNEIGAYWGSKIITDRVRTAYSNMPTQINFNNYSRKEIEGDGLSLAQILGKEKIDRELHQVLYRENDFVESEITGSYPQKIRKFNSECKGPKVFITHDSFAGLTMKYIPSYFSETVYCSDAHHYKMHEKLLNEFNPDVVITLVYGSNLGRLVPDYKNSKLK